MALVVPARLAVCARRVLLAGVLSATLAPTYIVAIARPAACASKQYHAKGVVKSFGANRAYVNIAHDDIPGYMMAMTMSFEPKAKAQLDGITEKDHVEFDFVDSDDGHRVLIAIQKKD